MLTCLWNQEPGSTHLSPEDKDEGVQQFAPRASQAQNFYEDNYSINWPISLRI